MTGRELKADRPKPKVMTSTSWDGRHVLEFNEGSHRYRLDGRAIKGATTVGSAYPKAEALIRWMVAQGIEEYKNQSLKTKGAEIGTILHAFAEAYEKGLPFDMAAVEASPHREECERVIGRFLERRAGNADRILASEEIVASVELQVGGKIDTLREREGLGLVLSDYKTSKGIYMEQLNQVIGVYRRAYREWRNMDIPYVEIVTFPKLAEDDMHVLLADKDGWVKDGVRTDVPDFFERMEAQAERNVGTYRFRAEVDELLFPSHRTPKEGV